MNAVQSSSSSGTANDGDVDPLGREILRTASRLEANNWRHPLLTEADIEMNMRSQ